MISNNVLKLDEKWSKIDSDNGVICYERKSNRSYYMEHRANAVIDSPIEGVVEILKNVPAYPAWMYSCSEAKTLDAKDKYSKLVYYAQGPSLNKWGSYMVISARKLVDMNSGKIIITLKSVDDDTYRYPDMIVNTNRARLTGFRGSWRLDVLSKTSTKVCFTVYMNPDRQKNEYMVNNLMRNICFYSVQGLLMMIKNKGTYTS